MSLIEVNQNPIFLRDGNILTNKFIFNLYVLLLSRN